MSQQYQIGSYRETYRSFKLEVPERYNWAYEVFDHWARDPRKVAMVWAGDDGSTREVTFREMSEGSSRIANALAGIGARPGDRVLTMLPRVVEWWELVLGCMRRQLVPVPVTTLLTESDLTYRINASESSIVVTDPENVDKIEAVRPQCPSIEHVVVVGGATPPQLGYEDLVKRSSPHLPNPNNLSSDPLNIYFTSGTTGYPKMVVNTHASYPIAHIATGKYWLDNRPTDLHWTPVDTGWAQASWTCFYAPWNMGAALFVWEGRGRFDAEGTLRMFEKYPITTFFGPTTAYRLMVQEDLSRYKPAALRHCVGAGEAVNPEVIDAWRENMGLHIWEGYGQTETTLLAATFPGMEYRPGSMGVVGPGFEMAVVDDDGNELAPGQEGEIAVKTHPERPIGLFKEYWKNEEANAKCFRNGWYYTGDVATRDEDGYYWFVGRADDVIISAAYRIGPFEVESALLEHDAVTEAAVVGKDDTMRGQIVKAFVVLAPGSNASPEMAAELQDHVKRVTAPYKYPREIEFLDDLPKTISGKIRRNELRDLEKRRAGSG